MYNQPKILYDGKIYDVGCLNWDKEGNIFSAYVYDEKIGFVIYQDTDHGEWAGKSVPSIKNILIQEDYHE